MTAKEPDVKRGIIEQVPNSVILLVVASYAAAFVVFGFLVDDPGDIARGLVAITTTRDTLLTDYFGVCGIGAASPPFRHRDVIPRPLELSRRAQHALLHEVGKVARGGLP
jgi:hypothetical protein